MPELIFLFSFLDTCLGKKYDAGLYFRLSACRLDLPLSVSWTYDFLHAAPYYSNYSVLLKSFSLFQPRERGFD
jgi:uncharacterized membrane protein